MVEVMKAYQFEEIVFWLSFIAYLISRVANCDKWVQNILLFNSSLNLVYAIYFAYKNRKR